ncbi:MAG: hypothetical protein KC656_07335 [Myxococcales bacterium]|nr:hypothetical protein [Myxococcales bacterium]MCB9670898.1 hypothetical protein [Alphaproteobacteria bacterium]MCB9691131.1 hypothetical protein [Alphaproteobacteria bacterium]
MRFPVSGTQCRPAGLPLFVMSSNNLNPRVEATDAALLVKVVTTTPLPWSMIRNVHRRKALWTHVLAVTCGSWEYLLHFRDEARLAELEALLADRC